MEVELKVAEAPTIENAYAVYLTLTKEHVKEFIDGVNSSHKVEIMLDLDGEKKEFTYIKFKNLLGFKE